MILSAPFIVSLHVFVKTGLVYSKRAPWRTALCLYFCRCRTIYHAHSYTNDVAIDWLCCCGEVATDCRASFLLYLFSTFFAISYLMLKLILRLDDSFITAAKIVVPYYIVPIITLHRHYHYRQSSLLSHVFLFLVFFPCHRTITFAIVRTL